MAINIKLQSIQQTKAQINEITTKYQSVLQGNYGKNQKQLIEQLLHAKELKEDIIKLKERVSQENLEQRISQKRRMKEKERQGLQSKWRQCTQSYKELQEQQKRLTNQQTENLFQVKNLQSKITQFQSQLETLKLKISKLQENHNSDFVTETSSINYQSPYKKNFCAKDILNINQPFLKYKIDQNAMFSQKYPINKVQNNRQMVENKTNNNQIIKSKKTSQKVKLMSLTNHSNKRLKIANDVQTKERLLIFLQNPTIKCKIFELLHRDG